MPGCTAAGRIPWESAHEFATIVSSLLGDTDAGMYIGTANFPGNWYSQPRILYPFGKSAQELPVEYHGWITCHQFVGVLIKKGYRQRPGSGNLGESLVKATISQRQYWYQNHIKITQEKTNFLCVYPLLVLRLDLDSPQDSRNVTAVDLVQEFFKTNQNWRSYRGKTISALWIVTTPV